MHRTLSKSPADLRGENWRRDKPWIIVPTAASWGVTLFILSFSQWSKILWEKEICILQLSVSTRVDDRWGMEILEQGFERNDGRLILAGKLYDGQSADN